MATTGLSITLANKIYLDKTSTKTFPVLIKNEKNVLGYFVNVIFYAIIISLVVSILGFTFGEKVFLLMNSTTEVTSLGLKYIQDIYFSSPRPPFS